MQRKEEEVKLQIPEEDEMHRMPEEKNLNATPDADPLEVEPKETQTETELNVKGFEFSDKSIRQGFIRKVYGILSVNFVAVAFH